MGSKRLTRTMLLGFALAAALVTGGCSQESRSGDQAGQVSGAEQQLYTCGMHPNVIQEEPGNCPICGMNLVPIVQMSSAAPAPSSDQGERKILYWRAPMDPTYISPAPGKSPMGMDLVPVYEGEEAFGATVRINPVVEQNMGVRTAPVERRDLQQSIRALGRIDYAETNIMHIHTKYRGWIEHPYVHTTGQRVKKGDALLDIYSPELVTTQNEYLDAYTRVQNLGVNSSSTLRARSETILKSARRRLENFDISEDQIQRLAATGVVTKTLTLISPFDGVVIQQMALHGMEVTTEMTLYTIADLSVIWVYADIYEYEAPWVHEGQRAIMTLSYIPGRAYTGQIQYVYPYLDEKTRTIRVRLEFANPDRDLKPGMYANVKIETSPLEGVIAVPQEAVLFSGERNLVFISLGAGRFAPRDVTIGIESGDGFYEVKEGLSEGEIVVTSGQFLLDSESKLQESIAKLLQIRNPGQESLTNLERDITHDHREHGPHE
ncbi:MAG: efflux RND transporter periplasmic adaptor subunit [Candidatus Marinimicrobia bacterium]|nr:efflux RND transporter periplasmic adaptor subunit [Candidatus Neomarinimicrobiota bacterium]